MSWGPNFALDYHLIFIGVYLPPTTVELQARLTMRYGDLGVIIVHLTLQKIGPINCLYPVSLNDSYSVHSQVQHFSVLI